MGLSRPVRVLAVGDLIDPDQLAQEGFSVATESTPGEAKSRLEADFSSIDCILSAFVSTNGLGRSFLESIRPKYPRLPFVLISDVAKNSKDSLSSPLTATVGEEVTIDGLSEVIESIVPEERADPLSGTAINHLDAISDGFFVLDADWRFTYINPEGQRLIERDATEILGEIIWDEFEEAVDLAFYSETQRAMEEQEPVTFEEYYPPLDTWFEVHAYPTQNQLAVYFIDISQRKTLERALLAGGGAELEFEITDSNIRAIDFADRIDGWLRLEGIVPQTGRSAIAYGTIGNTAPERVEAVCAEMDFISNAKLIEERDEGMLFEFTVNNLGFVRQLAQHSAALKALEVTGDAAQLVVALPHSSDIREFVERLTERWNGISLTAQRNDPEIAGLRTNRPLQEDLTDRQMEVLEVAFASGYFDWPRRITGEELADRLGISPPTLHQHLRMGLSEILDMILMSDREPDLTD